MILFSPAKINLGLWITSKRKDGYHNLQSIMVPVDLCDILEIRAATKLSVPPSPLQMTLSGIPVGGRRKENLCFRAWKMYADRVPLPPLELHLHKQIPPGAGLGGGSSNAATTLMALNQLSGCPLENAELHTMAERLGSDCPFFLKGRIMMARGRGEILSDIPPAKESLHLVLLFPGIHISTADAYSGIVPKERSNDLADQIRRPVSEWTDLLQNDFEIPLFQIHPLLKSLKEELMASGALFSSLTGSGSAIYGLFGTPAHIPETLRKYRIWQGPVFTKA